MHGFQRAAFGTIAASQGHERERETKKMKANFSTTDLIYYPGDFLPSINVIFGDLRRHKVRITRSRSAQLNLTANRWLTGICA